MTLIRDVFKSWDLNDIPHVAISKYIPDTSYTDKKNAKLDGKATKVVKKLFKSESFLKRDIKDYGQLQGKVTKNLIDGKWYRSLFSPFFNYYDLRVFASDKELQCAFAKLNYMGEIHEMKNSVVQNLADSELEEPEKKKIVECYRSCIGRKDISAPGLCVEEDTFRESLRNKTTLNPEKIDQIVRMVLNNS